MLQKELSKHALRAIQKIMSASENGQFFNEPFKHVVIDNFFDSPLLDNCLKNFPSANDEVWENTNFENIEIKSRTKWQSEFDIPDGIIDIIRIMNSSLFLNAMTKIFGIEKIVPDPYFSGGGLNVMRSGGLLDVHVDGNYHDATGLNRRLNAILYLNTNWQDSWGGDFGCYDSTGKVCLKKYAPIFNRLIIFDTHDLSFHGLPEPLNLPEGIDRKSIILYYYTKESRPTNQSLYSDPHSALWVKKGIKDKKGGLTRRFY